MSFTLCQSSVYQIHTATTTILNPHKKNNFRNYIWGPKTSQVSALIYLMHSIYPGSSTVFILGRENGKWMVYFMCKSLDLWLFWLGNRNTIVLWKITYCHVIETIAWFSILIWYARMPHVSSSSVHLWSSNGLCFNKFSFLSAICLDYNLLRLILTASGSHITFPTPQDYNWWLISVLQINVNIFNLRQLIT